MTRLSEGRQKQLDQPRALHTRPAENLRQGHGSMNGMERCLFIIRLKRKGFQKVAVV